MKCPHCSTDLPEGTKFCTSCGAPQEPGSIEVATAASLACPKCGATLPLGAKFCESCGAPTDVAVVTEEKAVAQPAPATGATATAMQAAQTAGPVTPMYPVSTPEGFRCPKCGAFLQPGSTFCASCGGQLAEAVPYGGGRAASSGISPAIPIVIGIVFLGLAGFGGWWWWSHKGTTGPAVSTTGTTTTGFTAGGTLGTTTATTTGLTGATTGGETDDSAAASAVALEIFNAVYQRGDVQAVYQLCALGSEGRTMFPDAQTFVQKVFGGVSDKDRQEMMSAMSNVQPGTPSIMGDRAQVPISFTATIEGKTVTGVATSRLIKEGGVWKLDMTGNQAEMEYNSMDALGMVSIKQQMAATATTSATTTTGDASSGLTTGGDLTTSGGATTTDGGLGGG